MGKLCIFDVDNTLTRGTRGGDHTCGKRAMGQPSWRDGDDHIDAANYAARAIEGCKSRGYDVAVATSAPCVVPGREGDIASRLRMLEDLGMPKTVARGGKAGPDYKCNTGGTTWKSGMINDLIESHHTTPRKTVFFDDQKAYLREAKSKIPELKTQVASAKQCSGSACSSACGLSRNEFHRGIRKIKHQERLHDRHSDLHAVRHSHHHHHHHHGWHTS